MSVDKQAFEITSRLLGAAIGLAARHFPLAFAEDSTPTTTRADVLYILDGHIAAWSGWSRLYEPDARRFGRLLRRRPNQYANAESTGELLDRLLEGGQIAGCAPGEFYKEEVNGQIIADPGMPLTDFVDQRLREIDGIRIQERRALPVASPGIHTATARVSEPDGTGQTYVDLRFELQEHHIGQRAVLPVVEDAPPLADHWVSFEELAEIASLIDAGTDGTGATTYRRDCVERFRREIRTGADESVDGLLLTSGTLNELLAYTGFGKSVVMTESLACWAVRHEVSVAFVLPTNANVVQVSHRIEEALKIACGDREPKLVPLVSPRSMINVAEAAASRVTASGPDADWIWDRFGYGCALAAVATTEGAIDGWQPGREPCAKLRHPRPKGKKPETVACPWRTTCGRYRAVRAACSADVIVTSHANLMLGVLQAPVDDGNGPNDRLTVEELVLRRCQVVVIDEVDLFQGSAIEQSGRGLLLDYAGNTNTPLREFDADFGAAFGRLREETDVSVRDAYFGLRYLAETYVSHLAYARMGPMAATRRRGKRGPHRSWIVPRRWDNWLTAKLFNVAPDAVTRSQMTMFRSLFLGEKSTLPGEPPSFAPVREALAAMVTGGAGRATTDVREALQRHTAALPENERARIVNLILRRALLERARLYLHRLMANNTQLVDIGVESAQKIADALGIYGRWRITPTGPLNRLVFAFTEYHDDTGDESPKLSTAAFGGDPHTYVVTLGDTTALAHAETRRIVLGLSATAYFPGAPHHHVHVKPRWWVPDRMPAAVQVLAAPVKDGTGTIRVSGLNGAERVLATKRLAGLLWAQYLAAELTRLKEEEKKKDRARILLATTSYASARHVAEGLAEAGVHSRRICLAVPPDGQDRATTVMHAGNWSEIPADRLEIFPGEKDADILIAPLARVQRGVNIIGKDDRSALGSIWLIVRPIPIIDEPAELLAHIQAKALTEHPGPSLVPTALLAERRQAAGRHLEEIIHRPPYFQAQPETVRLGVMAEIMVGAIQLVGRARRGGTPAELHLVDGAMLESSGGTDVATLIDAQRDRWRMDQQLDELNFYYETPLSAFFDYADRQLKGGPSC